MKTILILFLIIISSISPAFASVPSPPVYFDLETTISKLPTLGETADVTITVSNWNENFWEYLQTDSFSTFIRIGLGGGLRFVDIPEDKITIYEYGENGYSEYFERLELKPYQTQTFTVTVMSIYTGESGISVNIEETYAPIIELFIGKDETLFFEDYDKINPHYRIQQEAQYQASRYEIAAIFDGILVPDVETEEDGKIIKDGIVDMYNQRGQIVTVSYDTAVKLIIRGYLIPDYEPAQRAFNDLIGGFP